MDNIRNVLLYRTTMAAFKTMLKEGLISEEEYADIDTTMLQKYGLSLCSILSDTRLITSQTRGNMPHYKEVALCQR